MITRDKLAEMHRAAVVGRLRYNEASAAAVLLRSKALSMLTVDLEASMAADLEATKAWHQEQQRNAEYQQALMQFTKQEVGDDGGVNAGR